MVELKVTIHSTPAIASGPADNAINTILYSLGLLQSKSKVIRPMFMFFIQNPSEKYTSEELMNILGIKNKNTLFHALNKLISCSLVKRTTIKQNGKTKPAYKLNGNSIQDAIKHLKVDVESQLDNLEATAKYVGKKLLNNRP